MTATGYDIVTVAGGIGGASFARGMAALGRRVLVLERETQFKDRVRGEWLSPWGVEETRLLGIYDLLCDAGAHELPKLLVGNSVEDLVALSPENNPSLTFYHPDAQTTLLAAAADAGAEVATGVRVTDVRLGSPPSLAYTRGGEVHEITARLVVGADGRTSLARKAIGREEREHRASRLLAGGPVRRPRYRRRGRHLLHRSARSLGGHLPAGQQESPRVCAAPAGGADSAQG